jgi:hypothetical protein
MFIPDPDLDFFYLSRIPNPGVKKPPDQGTLINLRVRLDPPRCFLTDYKL